MRALPRWGTAEHMRVQCLAMRMLGTAMHGHYICQHQAYKNFAYKLSKSTSRGSISSQ